MFVPEFEFAFVIVPDFVFVVCSLSGLQARHLGICGRARRPGPAGRCGLLRIGAAGPGQAGPRPGRGRPGTTGAPAPGPPGPLRIGKPFAPGSLLLLPRKEPARETAWIRLPGHVTGWFEVPAKERPPGPARLPRVTRPRTQAAQTRPRLGPCCRQHPLHFPRPPRPGHPPGSGTARA